MLIEEISEVYTPAIFQKDNQGAVFLSNNRQVVRCTKDIDILHHFLNGMVEENYVDIKNITSEENPNTS